jgi:hypothetical protein
MGGRKSDEELAGRKEDILDAWRELFGQVIDYFREQGIKG